SQQGLHEPTKYSRASPGWGATPTAAARATLAPRLRAAVAAVSPLPPSRSVGVLSNARISRKIPPTTRTSITPARRAATPKRKGQMHPDLRGAQRTTEGKHLRSPRSTSGDAPSRRGVHARRVLGEDGRRGWRARVRDRGSEATNSTSSD